MIRARSIPYPLTLVIDAHEMTLCIHPAIDLLQHGPAAGRIISFYTLSTTPSSLPVTEDPVHQHAVPAFFLATRCLRMRLSVTMLDGRQILPNTSS
jgi:hypothetical protein